MLGYSLAEDSEFSMHLTRTEHSFYASKHGCRFMQSTYEDSFEPISGQLDQKFIPTIGPLDQKWSFSMPVFTGRVFATIPEAPPALAEVFQTK